MATRLAYWNWCNGDGDILPLADSSVSASDRHHMWGALGGLQMSELPPDTLPPDTENFDQMISIVNSFPKKNTAIPKVFKSGTRSTGAGLSAGFNERFDVGQSTKEVRKSSLGYRQTERMLGTTYLPMSHTVPDPNTFRYDFYYNTTQNVVYARYKASDNNKKWKAVSL